ncbi:hypothetical protein ColTof4_04887 [Colletotrichum tofieldiae]|nr:hypothetical protein ColTof3_10867 [Colletotrichum tofieldiae]GKT72464.1 hypothetical protein ColTof4_04887 [Colletotrichum tofieldiae]
MALAVNTPFVAPSGPVFVDEADGNVAFGADESSRPDWSATQKSPLEGTTKNLDERVIKFDQDSFSSSGQDRVITTDAGIRTIKWTTKSARVRVGKATWLGRINDQREIIKQVENKDPSSFPKPSTTGSSNSVPSPPSTRVKRVEEMVIYGSQLNLPVHEIVTGSQYADSDMYIQLEWTFDAQSGTTTSGVFAVFDGRVSSSEYNATAARIRALTTDDPDVELDGVESDDSASPADVTSTKIPAHPSSTATGSASISTIGPAQSGGGGGGSSLSAGAIAGIVIGSVLGLSLIAFAIWFLLRRRRRVDHASHGAAYDSGHSPHAYLADKETHARVTESPHSPYSDDGQQPQHQRGDPEAVVSASAAGTTERRPLAPYGEEEHTPIAARSVEDMTRNGARSSTPNVNTNVSHLIEDGMTEDEIRRLEEEERALDDAIEQAGQGQGQSQGQGQRRQP